MWTDLLVGKAVGFHQPPGRAVDSHLPFFPPRVPWAGDGGTVALLCNFTLVSAMDRFPDGLLGLPI